jgi:hypothetical protein
MFMRTRETAVFWELPLLLVMLLGAIGVAFTAHPGQAADNSLTRAPMGSFRTEGCTYYCRSCGKNLHDIVTAVDTNADANHLENCNAGECSAHSCGSARLAPRVRQLWVDVQDAQGADLTALLERNADIAYYNEDRSAIQMHCAEGNIIASLPLSDKQNAAFLE